MSEQPAPETKTNILIVDDTPANLHLLSQILSKHGYKTRPVTSGEQALTAVEASLPHLILLDIMMPGMSGYDVCHKLKSNEKTRDIPVIFISALNETVDKVKAFEMGGVDYLTKPFQPPEVLARVRTHLALRRLQQQLLEVNQQLQQQNKLLQSRNAELQEALDTINTLSGLVPICAWCHTKIQNEAGEWVKLETYIEEKSEVEFTHGICPSCKKEFNRKTDQLEISH